MTLDNKTHFFSRQSHRTEVCWFLLAMRSLAMVFSLLIKWQYVSEYKLLEGKQVI